MLDGNFEDSVTQVTDPITGTRSAWRMRWFFAILLALWIFAVIAATVIVFYHTCSPFSFTIFSTLMPPVYLSYRFAKYLLPMSKEEYDLEALKIHSEAEKGQSSSARSQ